MTILLAAALIPAIVMMVYVYKKDGIEHEPIGLILRLLAFGALSTFAAMLVEMLGDNLLQAFFAEGSVPYIVLENFLVVAVTEEMCKWAVVRLFAWRNPAFDYRFDGIVYAVSAALGFAALENVLYVMQYGLATALTRAILSVPLHGFCGVFMGMHIGQAKACEAVGNYGGRARELWLSVLIPVLMHGFYDFCLSIENTAFTIVFYIFVILVYILSLRRIKKSAAEDCPIAANWNHPFSACLPDGSRANYDIYTGRRL